MEIKGLKRRVTVGFMGIITLLCISGMLSFLELNTLSEDTDLILRANKRNMELSRKMLNSLQSQNYAFVQIVAFGDRSLDSLCLGSVVELEQTIKEAKSESEMRGMLDSMMVTTRQLHAITERLIATPAEPEEPQTIDSTHMAKITSSMDISEDRELYRDYQPIYNSLLSAIDKYLNMSQDILAPSAESLHNNAYRAVTPVFISLVVMIVIVLMLYYFMLLLCVEPVVSMNKSLADYISFKVPFAPKGECRDEMLSLRENIETMIKLSKKLK
ncbi:MAG: hypothetical protein SNH35_00455 [Rikenellaceae bacterium]